MANVLKIGTTQLLEVVSGELILSDGTNQLTHALSAGRHSVKVDLSTNGMILNVDGIESSGAYIPIAQDLITVSEDIYNLTSNPSEAPPEDPINVLYEGDQVTYLGDNVIL